jgi:eukaryotic-like serine/threonine-protein kinase
MTRDSRPPAPPNLAAALADRYRLDGELGQGGMATVYLAHDLRHDRNVAVKVLRPELAAVIGAERFLSEIRTTANLQHPHILPLFDSGRAVGQSGGRTEEFLFYVMPFIEGESLRDCLTREKQLPIADAVRIASEVASALDYAHRHNVIHRDIKPENILLHDGRALVADFGIALAASKAGGHRLTETGMSLGTPHYMSPEQAMGEREITARSDVYALGCVTYEMLLGEPPFTGPTAQSIVAKVMTEKPAPLTARRDRIPAAVEEAVLTALEKLPADRWGSAAEYAEALAGGKAGGREGGRIRRAPALPPSRLPALIAFVAVAALAAWGWLRPRPASAPPSRLALLAPGIGGSGGASLNRQLTLTPDGGAVIFTKVFPDGVNRLVRQPLDAAEGSTIPGTEGMAGPQLSPDGRSLITTIQGKGTFHLPAEGGTPTPLPPGLLVSSWLDWDADGTIWHDGGGNTNLGMSQVVGWDSLVPRHPETTRDLVMQQILPGHRALMVVRGPSAASGPAVVFDLKSGKRTPLIDRPLVEVRYTAGYLVYVLPDGTLQAMPFNRRTGTPTGEAVTIATGVSVTGTGIAQLAAAPNGTVAYIPEEPRSLVFIDRAGAVRPAIAQGHNYHAPHFSPDGRRLSVDFNSSDGRDVWILSLEQGTLTRATFDHDGHDGTWTPDGHFLTYTSIKTGVVGLYRTRPGSATPAESLLVSPKLAYTGLWLPDGSGLLTVAADLAPNSGNDIALITNAGRGPLQPIVVSRFDDAFVGLSPDGKWCAFVSTQSGRPEVYVRPLKGDGDQVQVSLSGGGEPVWGPDGKEIFYRSETEGQVELMAASVLTRPQFEVTARRALFPIADMVGTTPHAGYDISPDGKTFVMVRRSPAQRIMVIQNLPGLVAHLQGTK